MEYTLIYRGNSYELPKFTKKVKDKIDRISEQNESPSIKDYDKYKGMYDFIREMIGAEAALEIFETDDIDEMDLNEIAVCFLGICSGYDKPVNEAKKEISDNKIDKEDMQMVLEVLRNAGNLKELEKVLNRRPQQFTTARLGR